MVIGGIIFTGGAKIIRESHLILMESVPEEFDLDAIRRDISDVEGVEDVHELHLVDFHRSLFADCARVCSRKHTTVLWILAINHS